MASNSPDRVLRLAQNFLSALTPLLNDTTLGGLKTIAITSDRTISAVNLWLAVFDHAMDKEGMAGELLTGTFGQIPTDYLQYQEPNGSLLAADFEAQWNIYAMPMVRCTKKLLSNLLMPIRNIKSRFNVSTIPEDERTDRSGTFRENLLRRDNCQCRITERIDREYLVTHPNATGIYPTHLEAAHIVPIAVADRQEVHDYIMLFSGGRISNTELFKDKINKMKNGMMLQRDAHTDFDNFLWGIKVTRDAAGTPIGHKVKKIGAGECSLYDDRYRSIGNTKAWGKLVKSAFLELHYAVGWILYDSRLEEAFDEYYDKMRDEAQWVPFGMVGQAVIDEVQRSSQGSEAIEEEDIDASDDED